MRPMQWRSSSSGSKISRLKLSASTPERVRPVDPAVGARRMHLHRDQRVEVPADALDVGRQEDEAAVLDVEGVAVEVDELGAALVERGAHHLDDVRDRRHRRRGRREPRAPSTQKRHGAPCTLKPQAPAGMDQQVVPQHARDATHRHPAGWCAGRRTAAPRSRAPRASRRPVAARIDQPVPAVGAAKLERRDRRAGRVDRHARSVRALPTTSSRLCGSGSPGRREAARARRRSARRASRGRA